MKRPRTTGLSFRLRATMAASLWATRSPRRPAKFDKQTTPPRLVAPTPGAKPSGPARLHLDGRGRRQTLQPAGLARGRLRQAARQRHDRVDHVHGQHELPGRRGALLARPGRGRKGGRPDLVGEATFRVKLPAPDSAVASVPATSSPTWRWRPVQGAVTYDMHVALPDGSQKDFRGIRSSALTAVKMTGTGVFRWRVRANFPKGHSGTVPAPGRPPVRSPGRSGSRWAPDRRQRPQRPLRLEAQGRCARVPRPGLGAARLRPSTDRDTTDATTWAPELERSRIVRDPLGRHVALLARGLGGRGPQPERLHEAEALPAPAQRSSTGGRASAHRSPVAGWRKFPAGALRGEVRVSRSRPRHVTGIRRSRCRCGGEPPRHRLGLPAQMSGQGKKRALRLAGSGRPSQEEERHVVPQKAPLAPPHGAGLAFASVMLAGRVSVATAKIDEGSGRLSVRNRDPLPLGRILTRGGRARRGRRHDPRPLSERVGDEPRRRRARLRERDQPQQPTQTPYMSLAQGTYGRTTELPEPFVAGVTDFPRVQVDLPAVRPHDVADRFSHSDVAARPRAGEQWRHDLRTGRRGRPRPRRDRLRRRPRAGARLSPPAPPRGPLGRLSSGAKRAPRARFSPCRSTAWAPPRPPAVRPSPGLD